MHPMTRMEDLQPSILRSFANVNTQTAEIFGRFLEVTSRMTLHVDSTGDHAKDYNTYLIL